MFKQLAAKKTPVRAFSISRSALVQQPNKSDSFKDRENAQENSYIKKHEAEQLKKLREKLEEQKKVVQDLEQELKDLKK